MISHPHDPRDFGTPARARHVAGAPVRHAGRAVALTALLISGCTIFTDVTAPDVVQPDGLENPAGAEALYAGAISGFALVFAGSDQGQVTSSGSLADEFSNAASSVIAHAVADQRVLIPDRPSYPYAAIQRARLDAERAVAVMQRHVPAARSRIGAMFALAGYARVFLGENMCSGIPLAHIVDGNLEYGQPLTTTAMLEEAVAAFDSAVVYGADSARILDLARVGRGRALLALGRFADARAAVGGVPTAYSYATQHSAAVQPNGIFAIINVARWITVSDREGVNGLDFRTAADPRVPTTFIGKGLDGATDVFAFASYGSLAAPIVLASGVEARLIEAEALLRDGDAQSALDVLNALRTTMPGLAALPLEATDAARVDQLFRERAFWLFATGHRHGDLRRLVRHYGRDAEAVFPTGVHKSGQAYGRGVVFPPDLSQFGNPSFTGCATDVA